MHANLTPFQARLVLEYLPPVEYTTYTAFAARRYNAARETLTEAARDDTPTSRREADQ